MFTKAELENLYYYADEREYECRRMTELNQKSSSYWKKEEEMATQLKLKIQMIIYKMD